MTKKRLYKKQTILFLLESYVNSQRIRIRVESRLVCLYLITKRAKIVFHSYQISKIVFYSYTVLSLTATCLLRTFIVSIWPPTLTLSTTLSHLFLLTQLPLQNSFKTSLYTLVSFSYLSAV